MNYFADSRGKILNTTSKYSKTHFVPNPTMAMVDCSMLFLSSTDIKLKGINNKLTTRRRSVY